MTGCELIKQQTSELQRQAALERVDAAAGTRGIWLPGPSRAAPAGLSYDTIGETPEQKAARAKKAAEPQHVWDHSSFRCKRCNMNHLDWMNNGQRRCLSVEELAAHRA